MKYKNRYDFAEKTINNLPFMEEFNLRVKIKETSISFAPRNGKIISSNVWENTGMIIGIIDGLTYAYDILKRRNYANKR